jgi:hypothetical protein
MENPFLQTGLLLHGNVPLAEDQNREAGGISLSRAKEPREKHTFSRSLTVKMGERLTGSVRSRGNLRGGGNFRLHAAAQRDTRISSCSGATTQPSCLVLLRGSRSHSRVERRMLW